MTRIAAKPSTTFMPFLQDPKDGSAFLARGDGYLIFAGGNRYLLHHEIPILIDDSSSMFSVEEILGNKPTTQDSGYRSSANLKNAIRRQLLPALSNDGGSERRYLELAERVAGEKILVLGAGDKDKYYRRCFPRTDVVTSDVHLQFGADLVIDAHRIPFKNSTFSLVLAAQVLEHTEKPWIVAAEMQRVTKDGGYLQVEVPFVFPYHSAPYDFYRFTPSALRFLFCQCELVTLDTPEGAWSAAAVAASQALVDSFRNRYLRMAALAVSRLGLGWMKYLDAFGASQFLNLPKGFVATYRKDSRPRTTREMLADVQSYV